MSLSVALAVNVYGANSSIVTKLGTPLNTGASLTSSTVIVIDASVWVTPSDTRTVNGYEPGPCASLGVQVNSPVIASMLAPVGAPTRLNVSVCAGMSLSVALAVNVYGANSS